MDEKVERVAKAIWEAQFDREIIPWKEQSHLQKEFFRMLASEAIRAMREPAVTS